MLSPVPQSTVYPMQSETPMGVCFDLDINIFYARIMTDMNLFHYVNLPRSFGIPGFPGLRKGSTGTGSSDVGRSQR